MATKKQPAGTKKSAASAKTTRQPATGLPPFETDSQAQNRHGKGREHNGSDGGHQGGRGMNH